MTGVEVVTAPAVTTNDPVVAPCGIVTLDDAPATVLLELESATTTPPLPAGCVSVTVPAPFLPLIIVVGVMETPPSATAGGVTVTVDIALKPEYLMPVTRRQMLMRMLNNLKGIYVERRNFRRALQVVDLILVIYPRSPEDVKFRAVLRHNLEDYRGALKDFEDYLKMAPEASDNEEVRQTAVSLRRSMAMMN